MFHSNFEKRVKAVLRAPPGKPRTCRTASGARGGARRTTRSLPSNKSKYYEWVAAGQDAVDRKRVGQVALGRHREPLHTLEPQEAVRGRGLAEGALRQGEGVTSVVALVLRRT